ncbi:MAG: hypothetical protein ACI4Q6_03160 [Huintestinicola sp.]
MFAQGYVKFSRKMLTWQWYTDTAVCKLFFHLMLTANIKDKDWRGVHLKRGDVVSSLPRLAEETGLSVSQVRTALKKLESSGEIKVTIRKPYTLYTVLNYESFQEEMWDEDETLACKSGTSNDADTPNFSARSENVADESQMNSRPLADESQTCRTYTINKKYNKEKNYDNYKNPHTHIQNFPEGRPSFDLEKILEHAITHTPTV